MIPTFHRSVPLQSTTSNPLTGSPSSALPALKPSNDTICYVYPDGRVIVTPVSHSHYSSQ